MNSWKPWMLTCLVLLVASQACAAPPVAADDRLVVELIAAEPDLVTPTGVAVDERGRIWVIENHTHQRPAKYKGPAHDRVRIFEDFGPDGKARKITTFADGFKDTMGIALGKGGDVFLATRSTIYLLRDTKGSGQADVKKVLAHLDTKADYPHNGLSGFAIDALGELHFGLGENFGAPYKLIGSDKTTLTGGGEGGSIYRMKPDGTGLVRLATGFWNPFHMAFDRWGRLFAVDNDPDARGPCRLLHIVPGGDYGYRFKYGRKGIHPFQSWNGELPGTLPMVAGTAEAPSGIVAYESDGLPEEYRGLLLVTSWGDHVIEQFALEPRGASFGAKKKIMVRGGEDFRPVGIALAPDGSVVVSDWVDKSYPVHGKGRLWRIWMKKPPVGDGMSTSKVGALPLENLDELLRHPKKEIRLTAAQTLMERGEKGLKVLKGILEGKADGLAQIHALWATAQLPEDKAHDFWTLALASAHPETRGEAAAFRSMAFHWRVYWKDYKILKNLADNDPSLYVRHNAVQALARFAPLAAPLDFVPLLGHEDPFLARAAMYPMPPLGKKYFLEDEVHNVHPRQRLGVLLALRWADRPGTLPIFLQDDDPSIRRAAIQWVAEERLDKYADLLDKAAAKEPHSREVFEAWLAAKEILDNPGPLKDPTKEPAGDALVLKVLKDAKQPAALRALALHMLRPDHPNLKLADLTPLLTGGDKALRTEAIRALAWRSDAESQKLLQGIAGDAKEDKAARLDAIGGLALSAASSADTRQVLLGLLKGWHFETDVLRSLRDAVPKDDPIAAEWWKELQRRAFTATQPRDDLYEHALMTLRPREIGYSPPAKPDSIEAWRKFLAKGQGDPAAGERVFFHSKGPRCFACHRIDGRGEAVGPDLSHIGSALKRDKLIESILEPSKEIAPAFVTWLVTMRDGKQHTGVLVEEGAFSTITLADTTGKLTVLKITEIEDRVAQPTSIMPADLHAKMTRQEFLDLLAFLEARK
jgi:putative membrane-bound dehydrogenase-like protein